MQTNWSFLNFRDRLTIRAQLTLLTALTCAIAVAAAAVGAAILARQSAVSSANHELQALARNMADRLDQHMFERYREIQNIADLEPLRSIWDKNPDVVRNILEQLQASLPEYAWLGFATPDGTVAAATKGMLEGATVLQRPWFLNGLKKATVEDVHEAKLLDKLLRTSSTGTPFRFVDVAMPVRNQQGNLAGVLGAHMSWTWADDIRQTVLTNEDAKSPAELWVVGRDGSVLIGASDGKIALPRLEEAQKADGTVFVDAPEKQNVLTALAPTMGQGDYPGLGWTVAARKPVTIIYAPANRLVMQILLFGSAVAVAASYLAWALAATITKPLRNLAERLDLVGRRDNVTSVDRQHGSLDLLHLSAAVRSLLRRVGLAEASSHTADATIDLLQREVEDHRKTAEEKMLRFGADLHNLQILADTDSLTGLLNRRAFLPFAEDAWDYFQRYDRKFCILMFDIDFFKGINDTFGHAAGDSVIREMGAVIRDGIRATDKVSRFGGEEFVVLLRETDEVAAMVLADRLRDQIGATTVTTGEHAIRFTTSVGFALATHQDRDVEDVIHAADKALYVAKATGKNRVSADGRADEARRFA